MKNTIRVNDDFTIAKSDPDPENFEQLALDGFRSVVNLQTQDETQKVSEADERRTAEEAGLSYRHIAVSLQNLNAQVVEQFRKEVELLPKPILVHCGSGKRAGASTMMHLAAKENQTGQEALERAKQMGLECDTPQLEHFVKSYLDWSHDEN